MSLNNMFHTPPSQFPPFLFLLHLTSPLLQLSPARFPPPPPPPPPPISAISDRQRVGKLEEEGGGGAAAQQGGQLTGARLGSGAAAPEGRVGVNLNPTKFCQILALSKF